MSWIIALVLGAICYAIASKGIISKNIDIDEWQFWAISLGLIGGAHFFDYGCDIIANMLLK